MLPIALDLTQLSVLLIGTGPATERRLKSLREAGCEPNHIPNAPDKIPNAQIIFIADFDEATSERLYLAGKAAGAIVNVEDKSQFCDFHVPAIIRRGDLLMTVSTGGASPTLARKIRDIIGNLFGAEWAERTSEIAQLRSGWRAQGASMQEVAKNTEAHLAAKGWLSFICHPERSEGSPAMDGDSSATPQNDRRKIA